MEMCCGVRRMPFRTKQRIRRQPRRSFPIMFTFTRYSHVRCSPSCPLHRRNAGYLPYAASFKPRWLWRPYIRHFWSLPGSTFGFFQEMCSSYPIAICSELSRLWDRSGILRNCSITASRLESWLLLTDLNPDVIMTVLSNHRRGWTPSPLSIAQSGTITAFVYGWSCEMVCSCPWWWLRWKNSQSLLDLTSIQPLVW